MESNFFFSYDSNNAPAGVDEDFSIDLTSGQLQERKIADFEVLASYFRDNTNQRYYDTETVCRIGFADAALAGNFQLFNTVGSSDVNFTNFSNGGSGSQQVLQIACNSKKAINLTRYTIPVRYNFLRINIIFIYPVGVAIPVLYQFHLDFRLGLV